MLINLFDSNGILESAIPGVKLKYKNIEYIQNQYSFDGITVFTDNFLFSNVVDNVKCKKKIAWLLEPKAISNNIYNIYNIENKFDFIFTHDESLLQRNNKYINVPVGGCWIPENNRVIGNKSKLISMIFSPKIQTIGHKLRHDIYRKYRNIDYFGRACRQISTKDIALSDYIFSVIIENCSVENYFTEKLIDCLITGTIPIYYGCSNIEKYFNTKSILRFSSLQEFDEIIKNIDKINILYDSIVENYNLCKQYCVIEDWLFDEFYSTCKL